MPVERLDLGQRGERAALPFHDADGGKVVQADLRIDRLQLGQLLLQLVYFLAECVTLHTHLLVVVLGQGQVVHHDLVLVVLVLQLDHVVRCLVLVLLRLLDDAQRLQVLFHFSLAVLHTKLLDLGI